MSRASQSMSQPTQHDKDPFTQSWLGGDQQCHGMIRTECSTSPTGGHLRQQTRTCGEVKRSDGGENGKWADNSVKHFEWVTASMILLQRHRLPPSKPLEIPPAHSASVTHNSVNKASSKRQERYAGMKDSSLMFSLWGCVQAVEGGWRGVQLCRAMLQ